jgi:hypoxanthine phosphoribosyltransferase
LAREIDADYRGRAVTLVVVLKGAAIFAADLVRQLTIPAAMEFVTASSYGAEVRSSGSVRLATPETLDLAGRDVLVVEDIVDSGLTYRRLMETLEQFAPASLALCTLLHKHAARTTVDIRYAGFELPNLFVVGYGMDYGERYRNLPDIRVLSFVPRDV